MGRRLKSEDCWIHVFENDHFGGRIRQLELGECELIRKIGSIIVGPKAQAEVVDRNNRTMLHLNSRKLIKDAAKLVWRDRATSVRVAKA